MSRDFPALIDIWAMVSARRGFKADWPLAKLPRLVDMLASPEGEVAFEIHFDVDEINIPYAQVAFSAQPWLTCQRSLEPFQHSLERNVRLGLMRSEGEEASLPEGYEPYLVPDEPVKMTDLFEDELILSLPLVPMRDEGPFEQSFGPQTENIEAVEQRPSPFSVLDKLKS